MFDERQNLTSTDGRSRSNLAATRWSKLEAKTSLGNLVKSAARLKSPSKARSRKEETLNPEKPFSEDSYYTTSIKLFHKNDSGPVILTGQALLPMPPEAPIPGYVCKAARLLLNESQAWLWQEARVSRKTINDFENGSIEPKIALNNRLRSALEEAGAGFLTGDSVVGVVVYTKPGSK